MVTGVTPMGKFAHTCELVSGLVKRGQDAETVTAWLAHAQVLMAVGKEKQTGAPASLVQVVVMLCPQVICKQLGAAQSALG
jgi:hypothetical protein